MLARVTRAVRRDDGFTLPELLITVVILGVIAVPLCQIVISYLINAQTIRSRLVESKDQQIAAQFWASDVASVGQRDGSFTASNGIASGTCGSIPSGAARQITFLWTTYSFLPPSTTVTSGTSSSTYYSIPQTSTTGGKLVRNSCPFGGVTSSVRVANTLQIDALHPIQCSVNGTSFSSCSTTAGSGASGVYLRFFSSDPSGKGQPYSTTLGGEARQTQ